jgi:hypothetical protein
VFDSKGYSEIEKCWEEGQIFVLGISYNSRIAHATQLTICIREAFFAIANSLEANSHVILFNMASLLQLLTKFFMACISRMG